MSKEASLMYGDFLSQDDTNKDAPIEYYIEWLVDTINDLRRMLKNKEEYVTALQEKRTTQSIDKQIELLKEIESGLEKISVPVYEELFSLRKEVAALKEQIEHCENRGGFEESGV